MFPGSTRAAVFGMTMTVGDRVIKAQIKERDAARKMYEAAKAAGKSASLLEQQRPNVFQMNVANIMPGDRIKVELEYTELVPQEDGTYEFVYPAVVGPRYTETTAATAGKHDKFAKQPYLKSGNNVPYAWDMGLKIAAGVPIQQLKSPSHRIDSDVRGSDATVTIKDGEKAGDSDFVLRYQLRGEAISSGLLLYPGGEENFFLTMVQPPKTVDDTIVPPREYIFVVDVSGSMHGFPLDTAKSLMRDLFAGMQSQDRFNVMMFSGGSRVLNEHSVPATRANLDQALDVMGGTRGGGGTRILPALKRALDMPAAKGMSRTFVIITDGYVTVEAETFDLIRQRAGDANVFTFGIGTSVNRFLIDGMAYAGMGEPFVALNAPDARKQAAKFHKYISSPALTDIKVSFEGFDAYDVEPPAIPDLFAQRPIVVFGKYRGKATGKIILEGSNAEGRMEKVIDVSEAKEDKGNEALRYLWARSRIRRVADMHKLRPDDGRKKEVTALGLKYNLMTAFTSFIAVDEKVRNKNGDPTKVNQPLPLPKGVTDHAIAPPPMVAPSRPGSFGMGGRSSGKRRHRPRPAYKMELAADVDKSAEEKPRAVRASRLAHVAVSGKLTAAAVSKQLDMVRKLMVRCLASAGSWRFQLTIGADGKVSAVKVLSGDKGAASCLTSRVRRVRFPALGGTSQVTFTLAIQ